MNLYEADLPERIFAFPGREDLEWYDMRPIGSADDEPIPPLDDYLEGLRGAGYKFEEIPWPPAQGGTSTFWMSMVKKVSQDPRYGPHFLIPENTLFMPTEHAFQTRRSLYRCALHELSHSTAHASRLNRIPMNSLNSVGKYAREECIAELSGALLFVNLGGDPETLMSAWAHYVHTWFDRDMRGYCITGEICSEARKSARWMLGEVFE